MNEEQFRDTSCPRCHAPAQLYTVPLSLIPPSAKKAWQALGGECFRQVLETEPSDDLLMRPVKHGSRWRR
jgi:hypothetical protein